MNRPQFALGIGLCVIATMLVGTIPGTAFADTVSVSINGDSHDIDYTGTNVSISSVDVDTDFISLIFSVDVTADGTLEITFPRNVFDSEFDGADDSFIIIADGDEPSFTETETTLTSRTISISLDAGTEEVEIIGTVFGKEIETPSPEDPPVPVDDDVVVCTADYNPVCGVDGKTYGNMCNLDAADVTLDHTGECVEEKPVDNTPSTTCGEGTILRDGLCVPACGAGLVFENGACVIDQSAIVEDDVTPVEKTPASTPKATGSNKEFAVGTVAAFIIALAVMTILGLIAKASKSKN